MSTDRRVDKGDVAHTYNGVLLSHEKENRPHRLQEQAYGSQGERWGGRDSQGAWDGRGHRAVFNMENQQGPAGQHGELCSMSCGSQDGRAVWGRVDTRTCTAESLHYSPEAIP